jgi:hypothetical protein
MVGFLVTRPRNENILIDVKTSQHSTFKIFGAILKIADHIDDPEYLNVS